jgi:hypothetical protein
MKKLSVILAAMYVAFAVSAPVVFAAEGGKHSKEERAKHKADLLKKYDKNGDGKLDKDEKATAKADHKKAKAQHKHSH